VTKNRISDIVIVRSLNVIEKDHVLKFNRVAYNTLAAYKR
jgi:hypothetical protein